MPPTKIKRVVVGLSVKFELNSKDGLRRVVFGLAKDTLDGTVEWKINFQLFEREKKADPLEKLVELEIDVKTALHNKAETAADNGLTTKQAAHVLGPAAEDAKAAQAGEIDESEAQDTIQATLSK